MLISPMVFEPTVLGLEVLDFILVKNYVEIRLGTLWNCGRIELPAPPNPFQPRLCPFLFGKSKIAEAVEPISPLSTGECPPKSHQKSKVSYHI